MSNQAAPVSFSTFCAHLQAFPFLKEQRRLALALSGGSDSMALLYLLKKWCDVTRQTLLALIVDHGLRLDSAQEALQVQSWAKTLGVPSEILKWEGEKPQTGIQRKAREKRYELLLAACWKQDMKVLFLGHHQDDQLETFFMRQERGSGAYGLACMQSCSTRLGIRLCRPLLTTSKASLQSTLAAAHLPWLEDPSNQRLHFTRNRIRSHLFSVSDIQKQVILGKIKGYAQRRLTLESRVNEAIRFVLEAFPLGYASVCPQALRAYPPEVQRLVLQKVLRIYGGQRSYFKQQELETFRLNVVGEPPFFSNIKTFGGCCLLTWHQRLWIWREVGLIRKHLLHPNTQDEAHLIWDKRFYVEVQGRHPFKLGSIDLLVKAGRLKYGGRPFYQGALASWPCIRWIGSHEESPQFSKGLRPYLSSIIPDALVDSQVLKVIHLGLFSLEWE